MSVPDTLVNFPVPYGTPNPGGFAVVPMAARSDLPTHFDSQAGGSLPGNAADCAPPTGGYKIFGIDYKYLLFGGAIAGIVILYMAEYKSHDCVPGSHCTHSAPSPLPDDDNKEVIRKLQGMNKNNSEYVYWRRSLMVALILTPLIIGFIKRRLPEWYEWLIVGSIIYLGVYFANSWMHFHYFQPNAMAINNGLTELGKTLADHDCL